MTHLGVIKLKLKGFKNPELVDEYLLRQRLKDCQTTIRDIKIGYEPIVREDIVRSIVWHREQEHIPDWVTEVITTLSSYLDVYIIPTTYLVGSRTTPSRVMLVIGVEFNTTLASIYLNYIIQSVEAFTNVTKDKNRKMVKNGREDRRQGKEVVLPGDIRLLSSVFRQRLIDTINQTLKELLEEIKIRKRNAFYNGVLRREEIEKHLVTKYGKQWRTAVSNLHIKST